jgi:hypothetical protein
MDGKRAGIDQPISESTIRICCGVCLRSGLCYFPCPVRGCVAVRLSPNRSSSPCPPAEPSPVVVARPSNHRLSSDNLLRNRHVRAKIGHRLFSARQHSLSAPTRSPSWDSWRTTRSSPRCSRPLCHLGLCIEAFHPSCLSIPRRRYCSSFTCCAVELLLLVVRPSQRVVPRSSIRGE